MTDPAKTQKSVLRAELRAKRDVFVSAMTPGEREAAEASLGSLAADTLESAHVVAGYIGLGSEISCMAILARAAANGAATALAHVDGRDRPMRFLRWFPGDPLDRGWFNLLQPPADSPELFPDLILTPLLGFDSQFMRIGQGAGFYDRVFAANRTARRLGVAWSVQAVQKIPCDPWDQPLDMVCTERKLLHQGF
ncbi:5-formyltetrahydrofolate cyclo-ligase [Sphingomonas montanisoli]|uniref:5-formyltetrahydrofolate cyclo-ligase n=1 Tax=Sphingomonas montanisoli TaxID=2606412 RepID=A0A5D9C4J9_9SPHN|nr:5-formyltetrahydrofolate cyclo-ligase [Sphingomonas montanisoli]TZG26393.1 5-formyltetrahydrofolate cyclo-ligase [Sphingomonas montanisoli]